MIAFAALNRLWLHACRWLTGLVFLAFVLPLDAAQTRVRVIAAPAAALAALRAGNADIDWLAEEGARGSADLTLVWGSGAYLRARSQYPDQPLLLLAQTASDATLRERDAALYWAPSLAQQLQLARTILPGLSRVGIFYRPAQRAEVDALRQLAGPALVVRQVSAALDVRDISDLAQRVDILLASNDDFLFGRDSAKLVLLTAYRHQRAWVGPTPAFVRAGAIASLGVSKRALLQAISTKVRYWQTHGSLGVSETLMADEVVCNAQVARSLNLILPASLPGCAEGR